MAATASKWRDLDGKAQEHIVSFLGYNASTTMRAVSAQCRQLVNRKVKSVKINKISCDPVHSLCLPARFPFLTDLKVEDGFGYKDDNCISRADLCHILGGGQRWDKLQALDIKACHEIDALGLSAMAKAVPNLQFLTARLPYSPKAPAAAAEAIAQLSKLHKLELHCDRNCPESSVTAELLPLTVLQQVCMLTLHETHWQAMDAIEKLASLTSLILRDVTGGASSNMQRLTCLTNLQHLELTTHDNVNCNLLGVMLASMSNLRSFTSKILHTDGESAAAVTAATQLTSLDFEIMNDVVEACPLLERCMRMPNLHALKLSGVEGELDPSALSLPAACANTLKCLNVSIYMPEIANALLRSAAFRSLKLSKLELEFIFVTSEEPAAQEFPAVLSQALCSQRGLHHLQLKVDMDDEDKLSWPADMWAQVAQHSPQLARLHLRGPLPLCGLGNLASLEHLQLAAFFDMEDVELVHLIPCQKLQSIDFRCCDAITPDGVAALTAALPRLQHLQVWFCNLLQWGKHFLPRSDIAVNALPAFDV